MELSAPAIRPSAPAETLLERAVRRELERLERTERDSLHRALDDAAHDPWPAQSSAGARRADRRTAT